MRTALASPVASFVGPSSLQAVSQRPRDAAQEQAKARAENVGIARAKYHVAPSGVRGPTLPSLWKIDRAL